MENKNFTKNILYLTIFMAFVVLVWIGLSVYHGIVTSTISTQTGIQINPISPTFDAATLQSLHSRKTIPVDLNQTPVILSVTPSIAPSSLSQTVVIASSSSQIENNSSASGQTVTPGL